MHRDNDNSLRVKTVEDFVERTGLKLGVIYTNLSESVLSEYRVDETTGVPGPDLELPQKMKEAPKHTVADEKEVRELAALYNDKRDGLLQIPESKLPVYIADKRLLGYDHDPRLDLLTSLKDMTLQDAVRFYDANIKSRPRAIIIVGNKKQLDMDRLRKMGKVVELKKTDIVRR